LDEISYILKITYVSLNIRVSEFTACFASIGAREEVVVLIMILDFFRCVFIYFFVWFES